MELFRLFCLKGESYDHSGSAGSAGRAESEHDEPEAEGEVPEDLDGLLKDF